MALEFQAWPKIPRLNRGMVAKGQVAWITRLTTQNSTYEIDAVSNRIRRLEGVLKPTVSQGQDGEWQDFARVHQHPSGVLIIEWPEGAKPSPATITSRIQTIEEIPS